VRRVRSLNAGATKDEAALHRYNGQPYGDLYVMRADRSDVRQFSRRS
jgi:TolB protein